jgi:hypothetical protein
MATEALELEQSGLSTVGTCAGSIPAVSPHYLLLPW